jgi:hypothetical protein
MTIPHQYDILFCSEIRSLFSFLLFYFMVLVSFSLPSVLYISSTELDVIHAGQISGLQQCEQSNAV